MTREFTCKDCGTLVFAFGEQHANDQDLCAECIWLRAVEDPVDREKLREFLKRRD
jgi:hypothetical protein